MKYLEEIDYTHPDFGDMYDSEETTFETLDRNLNIVSSERGELALTIPMACVEARKRSAENG